MAERPRAGDARTCRGGVFAEQKKIRRRKQIGARAVIVVGGVVVCIVSEPRDPPTE